MNKNQKINLRTYTTISAPTSKLPNIWIISKSFIERNPNLKYCIDHQEFYLYENYIWQIKSDKEISRFFINWLKKEYVNIYEQFEPSRLKEVTELFSSLSDFSMVKEKQKLNLTGFLIPFKNGILNSVSKEFLTHKAELYSTHIINVEYKKDNLFEETDLHNFIVAFCKFENIRIEILQAMLYTILTNTTKYQLAYYLYGPGGTGKSTLMNIMLYLIGPHAYMTSNLFSLNSRFGSYSLINKIFVLINDLDLYKGKEPNIVKNLTANDHTVAEKKYGATINITTNLILAMMANSIWEINNNYSGLNRRTVYFPTENIPLNKTLDLYSLDPFGIAVGKLVKDLPAFVNWILSCDPSILEIGGETLTKLVTGGSYLLETNPITAWIEKKLETFENGKEPIGNTKSDKKTLYGNYLDWCKTNNVEPIKIHRFSDSIIDNIKTSFKWLNVSKKRSAAGVFITGIRFKFKNKDKSQRELQVRKSTKNG